MKYDIFISCKSEDYELARNVYVYLVNHGYSVFLADTELRKCANAEFGKIIDSALDSAEHFILLASRPEYISSTYVESEWRIFIEEKRSGRKSGNIITILDEMNISSLPISLRHFQSFSYKDFNRIRDYLPISVINTNNNKLTNNDFILKYENAVQFLNSVTKYRDINNYFSLTIEEFYLIKGKGCVVCGEIESGKIHVGNILKLVRFNDIIDVFCIGIQMNGKSVVSAEARDNVEIFLKCLNLDDVSIGDVLTSSSHMKSGRKFTCDCYFIKELVVRYLQFNGTVSGTIEFATNSNIPLNFPIAAKVELDNPIPLATERPFTIEHNNETIGIGITKEIFND